VRPGRRALLGVVLVLGVVLSAGCSHSSGRTEVTVIHVRKIEMPTTTLPTTTSTAPTSETHVVYTCSTAPCKLLLAFDPTKPMTPGSTYALDGDRMQVVCRREGLKVVDPLNGRTTTTWFELTVGDWVPSIYVTLPAAGVVAC
jgi:hypothetical protein